MAAAAAEAQPESELRKDRVPVSMIVVAGPAAAARGNSVRVAWGYQFGERPTGTSEAPADNKLALENGPAAAGDSCRPADTGDIVVAALAAARAATVVAILVPISQIRSARIPTPPV